MKGSSMTEGTDRPFFCVFKQVSFTMDNAIDGVSETSHE